MFLKDSDGYSFRSGALTRATSTDGYSDQVITPLDEIPHTRPGVDASKTKAIHVQSGVQEIIDPARIFTDSLYSPNRMHHGRLLNSDIELEELAPENTSYFPSFTHRNAESPLVRRRSTRELIGRYEDMNHPSTSVASPHSMSKDRRNDDLPDIPPPLSEMKSKGLAPIRESFRNMLSVFGKNKKVKNEETSIPSTRYQSSEEKTKYTGLQDKVYNIGIPQSSPSMNSLKSGPLLYLCASPTVDTLPVWNYCIAKLHPTHLILEWSTSFGNPVTHSIPLASCTDVHSLPAAQVSYTERKLLPDQADTYIFKLTFHDGAPETFSAGSVSERSSWVSAIW